MESGSISEVLQLWKQEIKDAGELKYGNANI